MSNSEHTKTTVYSLLDNQTVNERKAFIEALKTKGINGATYRNWIGKRASIPEKYHSIINEIVGKELSFPKIKLEAVIED